MSTKSAFTEMCAELRKVRGNRMLNVHNPVKKSWIKPPEPENNIDQYKNLFVSEANRGGAKPTGQSFAKTQFDYNGTYE